SSASPAHSRSSKTARSFLVHRHLSRPPHRAAQRQHARFLVDNLSLRGQQTHGWSIIMSLWLVRSDVAALNPALARLVPVTPKESDTLHHLADGNYRLTLGADRFILHGTDWLYEATAASLTRTQSRANREADYRSLIELLPENRRTDLPAVANITRLS